MSANPNCNDILKELHGKIYDLDNMIKKLREEQIENVMKFRKLFSERDIKNTCKDCNGKTYPSMKDSVDIKPLDVFGEYNLYGDYENTVYLCYTCERPGIELKSRDSDYGTRKTMYL